MRLPWLAFVSFVSVLVTAAGARADDWLAVLPACGDDAPGGVPAFELIYPRAGLPAVVEAGQMLIARVRLPSPLTPPPGVQQARALVGWSAELIGHALDTTPSAMLVQRYPLEVVNVRPDGPASLIYRASLPIPAWAAPGSYDLVLSAPGGRGRAASLVRVLAQGATPRMAWVSADSLPEGDAITTLPIDIWVRTGAALTQAPSTPGTALVLRDGASSGTARARFGEPMAGAPLLDPRGRSAALRIGTSLWVFGGCHSPHLRFEDEVASVLIRESRTRLSVSAPEPPSQPGFVPWAGAFQAWPPVDALRIERNGEQWRFTSAIGASSTGSAQPREIALLLAADARAVQVSAGSLSFYPAGEIAAAEPPALVAWLTFGGPAPALPGGASIPGSGSVVVQHVAPASTFAPELIAEPHEAQSGELVHTRVLSTGAATRTAFRFDSQHTAFGRGPVAHTYVALGAHRIEALAIADDGRDQRVQTEVRVGTAQRSGCRCQLGAAQPWPPRSTSLVSLALVLDLMRLRVRRRRAHARKARAPATPE